LIYQPSAPLRHMPHRCRRDCRRRDTAIYVAHTIFDSAA
jgi:hypothetical protein